MNRVAGLLLGAALLTAPGHVFGSQIVAGALGVHTIEAVTGITFAF